MQEFVARENTTQLPTIHVISDSVGVTGQAVARAAAAQFGVTNPSIEVLPKADDFEEIRTFLDDAQRPAPATGWATGGCWCSTRW